MMSTGDRHCACFRQKVATLCDSFNNTVAGDNYVDFKTFCCFNGD